MPLADLKTGFSLEVFSVEFKNECVTAKLSSSLLVSVSVPVRTAAPDHGQRRQDALR